MASTLPLNGDGDITINSTTPANGLIKLANPASGAGNILTIQGSDATSGNNNGGDIILTPGAKSGTGSDGNIGVGVTSPGAKMEIKGDTHDEALIVTNSDQSPVKMLEVVDAASGSNDATVFRSAGGELVVVPQDKTSAAIQEAINYIVAAGSISSISTVTYEITTSADHGLSTGDVVFISGTNTTPPINGHRTITVTSSTKFTVGIDITAVTTGTGAYYRVGLGGTVSLPAGTYTIDSQITIYDSVRLIGAGPNATILNASSLVADAIISPLKLPTEAIVWRVSLKDFAINGNTNRQYTGIYLGGVGQSRIENVLVQNCKRGIRVKGWDNVITNCLVALCDMGMDLSWYDDTDPYLNDDLDPYTGHNGYTNAIVVNGYTYEGGALRPQSWALSSASWSSGYITFNTSTNHNLKNCDVVTVRCDNPAYDGTYTRVKVLSSTSFTVKAYNPGGSSPTSGRIYLPIIGCYIDGLANSLSGCTIENHPIVITAASYASEEITYTTETAYDHGLQTGDPVKIANCVPDGFNGTFSSITRLSSTQFKVTASDPIDPYSKNGVVYPSFVDSIGTYICGNRPSIQQCLKGPTTLISCYLENWSSVITLDGCKGTNAIGCYLGCNTDYQASITYLNDADHADHLNNLLAGLNGANSSGQLFDGRLYSLYLKGDGTGVGVGVTSPLKLLHLQKATGNNTYDDILVIDSKDGGAGNGGGIVFHNNESHVLARIKAIDADNWAGRLDLTVSKGTGDDQITAMTILGPGGMVGLGCTNPSKLLEVGRSDHAGEAFASDGQIVVGKTDGSSSYRRFKIGLDSNYNLSIGDYSYDGVTTYSPYLTVKYYNGSIGIGTTSPGAQLEITPAITATTDYKGVKSGLVYNGASAMANCHLNYIAAPSGTGTITNKYALVTEANAGSVGLGTTNPGSPLHIVGSNDIEIPSVPSLLALSDAGDPTKALRLGYDDSLDRAVISATDLGTAWKDILIAPYGGSVGIGITSPAEALHVNGNLRLGSAPLLKWSGNTLGLEGGQGGDSINVVEVRACQTYGARLDIKGPNNAVTVISLDGGNGATSYLNAGSVGIGTASPGEKLDVYGGNLSIRDAGTTAGFRIGANGGINYVQSAGANMADGADLRFTDMYAANTWVTITKTGNVGIGTASPTSILHTVASGAKTSAYSGNLLTNIATSSTASITKAGLEIASTGTWNGTSANNIGLYVSSVTGGTKNYDAIFNGGGAVGIGTTSPNSKLQVTGGDIEIGDTGKRLILNVNNTALGTQTDADGRKGLRVIRTTGTAPANSIRFGTSNMYLVWENA